jgi:hypothetical protein
MTSSRTPSQKGEGQDLSRTERKELPNRNIEHSENILKELDEIKTVSDKFREFFPSCLPLKEK